MTFKIVIKRLLFFVLVVWAASTIVFFIPRLSSRNAIRERFGELARTGGFSPADIEKLIASMQQQFGLDKPLLEQYWQYLGNITRLDFGYSLSRYPTTATEVIAQSLPWTIGLLLVTTVLSFVIGTLLGAVAAWPKSPGWLRSMATPFILLTGVPPVIMGILLLFFIGFRLKWLPLGGAYSVGVVPTWSWTFFFDLMQHQILPALALILGSVGGWVLSMRGMGITIQGEDYVNFAEHKGLTGGRIFRDYYLRNALLPQVTGLALALGTVVTSAVIVEGLFGLPGIGTALNLAIRANDFPVIYGIVIFITIAIAALMTILEFVYPLLDPRIREN
ncbi:ABC transporter permease [Devosia psychrophila]|jgi:peptide/nickel transport system permease protein|uniref:Oligopeptide ABC transporter permease n=1 Tax=Devosia psychrophila TaxID=728005 RepID=A0A0F5PUH7_9HYPH|nr:ABC transporter permease [Devosia psychrophila]KKC32255.1 oligopeptide ABC transporter permease [Devosia psychrophila]SFD32182.1 peptide/nickel transport system permease protein [Devosia psychrophila]